jgi:hypothetical protein
VKALEARFHPAGEARRFVVVGHVLCDGPRFIVLVEEHLPSALPRGSVLSNLRYIAAMSVPRPFEFLRAIDNRFWSFVEVDNGRDHEDVFSEQLPRR